MKYDKIVDMLLQEAYFSNPAEKVTGMKKHVNFESDTAFGETQQLKDDIADLGSTMAAELLTDRDSIMSKGEAIDAVVGLIGYLMGKHAMDGDEWTTADWKKYFDGIAEKTHAKPPATVERIRNVLKGAMKKVQDKMDMKLTGGEVKEPYEDPTSQAYQQAQDNLAAFKTR